MSISEKVLWEKLRRDALGFRFRRQVPIAGFYLDYFCAEAMLNIEVDGEQHELRKDRDQYRDRVMNDLGILTLRIPSLDLFDPIGLAAAEWMKQIESLCELRSGRKFYEKGKKPLRDRPWSDL